eukprot:GHVS01091607.1.p1 GENE.GHVS01091607.1~~GHVS01091607.1.p1  ORF type:complete len:535 (-),score=67.13 GHVS01091607.1:797-2380(-)
MGAEQSQTEGTSSGTSSDLQATVYGGTGNPYTSVTVAAQREDSIGGRTTQVVVGQRRAQLHQEREGCVDANSRRTGRRVGEEKRRDGTNKKDQSGRSSLEKKKDNIGCCLTNDNNNHQSSPSRRLNDMTTPSASSSTTLSSCVPGLPFVSPPVVPAAPQPLSPCSERPADVNYPISTCTGRLYQGIETAFRSRSVDAFIGTPVAFFVSKADLGSCALVCKLWFCELYSLPKLQYFYGESGIPDSRRCYIWKMLLLGESSFSSPEHYEMLATSASVHDAEIGRDVGRTYPDIEMFRGKLSEGQVKLGRLLRACSLQLQDVGYCQGMNFIAATLLLLFDEPTAFECMLALLHRYSMKDLYVPKLPKLQVAVYQLDRLVESFLPKVYDRLVSFNIQADFYSINWFMTLFSYDMSWPSVLKIWDQFLLKGWKVIFKVGLAMLYKIQNRLLDMQFDEALKFLKVFPKDEDVGSFCVNELLACSEQFAVSTRMLEALELAYRNHLDALVICLRDLDNNTVVWEVKTMPRRREG